MFGDLTYWLSHSQKIVYLIIVHHAKYSLSMYKVALYFLNIDVCGFKKTASNNENELLIKMAWTTLWATLVHKFQIETMSINRKAE